MSIKPVTETEVDPLFNELDRISELYSKSGPANDLSDKWIPAVTMRNLAEEITTTLAMELRKATTTDEMQRVINVYLHANRNGLSKGMPGPMVCLTTNIEDGHKTEEHRKEESQTDKTKESKFAEEGSINAVFKGKNIGDGVIGKRLWSMLGAWRMGTPELTM